jgi:hypothetical protein
MIKKGPKAQRRSEVCTIFRDMAVLVFNMIYSYCDENGTHVHTVRIWCGRPCYVTVSDKTQHMGFFVKFEFDASLISSTLELTRVQVLDRLRASLWSYSSVVPRPHPRGGKRV